MLYFMMLMSCLTAQHNISFNPTNSMCIDATVANIHAAGCRAVSVDKTAYGITKIYCYEPNDKAEESGWIRNNFYAIAFGTKIPDDVIPICTDPYLVMTTEERIINN